MYKLCKTEQSTKRQREIEDALLDMMLSKPFEKISVSELCDRLMMPRKAFYRYFESKEGALYALLDHTLIEYQGFGTAYIQKEKRSLGGDLAQFYVFWQSRKKLLDALEQSDLMGVLLNASLQYALSENNVNSEKFLPEDDDWTRRQVFQFAICGLMTSVFEWYRRGFRESTADMAKAACRMLSRPLFPALERIGLLS